jgi:rfaE bifunctional protein kinase chain/domain
MKNKKVAVIGDLMLDEYLIGYVSRISPEAPVPVVDIKEESTRFGGAANVCLNLATLGISAYPFGVVGDDFSGKTFIKMAAEENIQTLGIIQDKQRRTTVKTRVIGSSQQIVRVDKEDSFEINSEIKENLLKKFEENVYKFDAILLQDYNKGVMTKKIIRKIIEISKKAEKEIFVDPKFSNFFEYKNVDLFKPNLTETSQALVKNLETLADYKDAAKELKEKLSANNILITLSSEGMLLLDDKNEFFHTPTKAIEVADVSGAGDTVISTLVAAKVGGADLHDAIKLANEAAGIVVAEVGIIPITKNQLLEIAQ